MNGSAWFKSSWYSTNSQGTHPNIDLLSRPVGAGSLVVPFVLSQVVNVNQASARRTNQEIAAIMEVRRRGKVAWRGGSRYRRYEERVSEENVVPSNDC